MRILVIGGAGFIGSHTVDALLRSGHEVRVLDNLTPQVHEGSRPPDYLSPQAEFIRGDVCDPQVWQSATQGVDAVFYLAAAVGVGQSMYQIRHYTQANALGAASFLDFLVNQKHSVRKVVVASSMSIYGEGAYSCPQHGTVFPELRVPEQLAARAWEHLCPAQVNAKPCGAPLAPLPTNEGKPLFPTSIYAINKRDHEEMFLVVGRAYGIPAVALRYFNVYGPRQALSNPYTGVVAIFASRMLNRNLPLIYEDGLQSRDFVHVSDIVQANLLALEREEANYGIFNVGTGRPVNVLQVAEALREVLGYKGGVEVVNRYRAGDIRHCYADISKARAGLGYQPRVSFAEGMRELAEWLRSQPARDAVQQAHQELDVRGLVR